VKRSRRVFVGLAASAAALMALQRFAYAEVWAMSRNLRGSEPGEK
jgi:hypothetical protein